MQSCTYVTFTYSDLYVVAIDWPGHGLSSPRPAGSHYHMINYVADLKYVIDGMCSLVHKRMSIYNL